MPYAVIQADELRLSDRTCWILGAGASYDCIGGNQFCVPLTDSLIIEAPITKPLRDLLEPLLRERLLSAKTLKEATTSRIEFTIDELRGLTTSAGKRTRRRAALALREMIQVIASMISVGSIAAGPLASNDEFRAENYGWLAFQSAQFPYWSTLTLNYDTVLDWAFQFLIGFVNSQQEMELPKQYLNWLQLLDVITAVPGTQDARFESGLYLKLHGCLELFSCQNPKCTSYRVPYRPDPSGPEQPRFSLKQVQFLGLRESTCGACGNTSVQLILPPGRNKNLYESRYHGWVYGTAESVMTQSSPWVCLGYSAPDYDEDVVELCRNALHNRDTIGAKTDIYVVSPDAPTVAQRLTRRLNHDIFAYAATFTQLVTIARKSGRITRQP